MYLLSTLLSENLQQLLSSMMSTLPGLFGGLVLILVGFIVAKFVQKTLEKLGKKIGLDRLGEKLNNIDMIANANFNIELSKIISKIIYYFIILVFIVAATDVIGIPALTNLFNDILNWIPNLLVALVILAVGLVFADFLRGLIYTACNSFGIPSARMISLFAFYFLFINIVISALSQARVDTSFISSNISILIGGAALAFAIAYGLASKNVLSNFLSSHYSKEKLKIGDRITVAGHQGVITDMDRSNLVLASEGKKVIIPLHRLTTETIEIHNQTIN